MKTIQMTIDEDLLEKVDLACHRLTTSRSAFTRKALDAELHRFSTKDKEEKHRQGYQKYPVKNDEFSGFDRAWPN